MSTNRPVQLPASAPTPTPEADPRSTAEIVASMRRKLIFVGLAIAAPFLAFGLSMLAENARQQILARSLPEGIEAGTPMAPGSSQTVGDRLAEIGAEPSPQGFVDPEGRPVRFDVDRTGVDDNPTITIQVEDKPSSAALMATPDPGR